MNSLRVSFLVAICLVYGPLAQAQETSIDLRKDGRIIAGERKDFLLQCIDQGIIKVDERLRNHLKFNATGLMAIVVPPGKMGKGYIIGLVVGSDTLPDDYGVLEADFNQLRRYSTNLISRNVERKYQEIKEASSKGDTQGVIAKTSELRTIIKGEEKENVFGELYAGYLLANLKKGAGQAPYDDIVNNYEKESAMATLSAQVARIPELFSSPTPRLQTELLGYYQTSETARDLVSTLYKHQQDLPETVVEHAALLAFGLEDYGRAAEFVDTGLNASPGNKQLLIVRGLMQYEQSFYPQASASFQEAGRSAPETKPDFKAALIGNQGLVHWELGQTKDAEASLNKSTALFTGEKAREEQAFILLTQADLYADYGQQAKALDLSNQAFDLVKTVGINESAGIYQGWVHRLRAEVAIFHGSMRQAVQEIEQAIKIHQDGLSFLELAKDKDVRAEIEEQKGIHKEALKTLEEAADSYEKIRYVKGQSENQLKRSKITADLNRFEGAERLINDARVGFAKLSYKRGLGECETLEGTLILRRANHRYLEHFHQNMTPQEKQEASQEFFGQTGLAADHFKRAISIFREIGYKKGIANAQDKLAINLVSLDENIPAEAFSLALQNSKGAIQIYEEIDGKRGQAEAYGNRGIIFRKQTRYELAISDLENALGICQQIEFKLGTGRQLFNLGRVYYEKGFSERNEQDVTKAKQYFLDAQKVFEQTQAGQDELKIIDEYLKSID